MMTTTKVTKKRKKKKRRKKKGPGEEEEWEIIEYEEEIGGGEDGTVRSNILNFGWFGMGYYIDYFIYWLGKLGESQFGISGYYCL